MNAAQNSGSPARKLLILHIVAKGRRGWAAPGDKYGPSRRAGHNQAICHRRLYASAAGRYVPLEDLARMVEDEEAFVVRDAATGEDITPAILKQIMIERAPHG
jgi:hypothetical protein